MALSRGVRALPSRVPAAGISAETPSLRGTTVLWGSTVQAERRQPLTTAVSSWAPAPLGASQDPGQSRLRMHGVSRALCQAPDRDTLTGLWQVGKRTQVPGAGRGGAQCPLENTAAGLHTVKLPGLPPTHRPAGPHPALKGAGRPGPALRTRFPVRSSVRDMNCTFLSVTEMKHSSQISQTCSLWKREVLSVVFCEGWYLLDFRLVCWVVM